MLRFIPTKVHGMLDYAMGTFMSVSPLFMKGLKSKRAENAETTVDSVKEGLQRPEPQQIIPMVMGAMAGIYSLFTNYELGVVKKIPMRAHLAVDAISGAFMAAAPWIFGFYKKTWIPFVAMGVTELGAALFTQLEPAGIQGENFDA